MAVPADKTILTAAVLTLGSTASASIMPAKFGGKGELPAPRLLIGTSLTFIGLSMLGDYAPGFAAPLSMCIAITALTYYGIPVLDNYMNGKHNKVGANANTKQ